MQIQYDAENSVKRVISPDYNYYFNTKTGDFYRWGATPNEDPKVGMLEIFDLEVSEVCNGIPSPGESVAVPCAHCYKSNTKSGRNMTFDTFKSIFDKLPKTLTQIAFGIGDIDANPDLVQMFDYCRENAWNPGVVPNLTINGWGLTEQWADILASKCGAVAVSRYDNKDVCYDAVQKLSARNMQQVNIHMVVANENLDQCYQLIDDAASDYRLSKLRAIVFLTLKPKGKRNKWTTIKNVAVYRELVAYAMSKNVGIGFDSCSAPTFLAAMKGHKLFSLFSQLSESCESDRFSGYANVDGIWSHCSFTEGLPNWGTVDLKAITDFDSEVWNSPEVLKFRTCLTCQDNRHIGDEVYLCPVYDLYDATIGRAPSAIVKGDRKIFEIVEVG